MILVALGANLSSPVGAPAVTLRAALDDLARYGAVPVATSQFFVTPAWPNPDEPPFVNAVARIDTILEPHALLDLLHHIENNFGRRRGAPNAPRTLDLDLLDYDGRIEDGPPRLPHPRMDRRGFVLLPLADVAPHWRHPVTGQAVTELIAALPADARRVEILK